VGLVPIVAIGRLEQAEVLRRKETGFFGLGRAGFGGLRKRRRLIREECRGDQDRRRAKSSHRWFTFSPAMPPRVIASIDKISSSRFSSSNPRASTSSRMVFPLFTDSFAISAVAA